MAQNTLVQNIEVTTEILKDVKEAIIEKGVEIPEGTYATAYPGYIAQMTSQNEIEELKGRAVLKGENESEVRVAAPVIELSATEGNINMKPVVGQVQYNGVEVATVDDISALPKLVTLTQEEYDDLVDKDLGTYYFIEE